MIKDKKVAKPKSSKLFSLTEFTNNKVKSLIIAIEDLNVVMGRDITDKKAAIISGTLYINKDKEVEIKEGELDYYTASFQLPLDYNKDLKRHMLSIIKSVLEEDKKEKSNGGK